MVVDEYLDLSVGTLEQAHDGYPFCQNHPIVSIMELDPVIREVVGTFVFAHMLVHEPEEHESDEEGQQS